MPTAPFHTIILPALLLAHGQGLRLPDTIISSEYLTLEGRKISTSQNWAVWAKDLIGEYHPDAIRYFFLASSPEKRDADFSWREFREQNNAELVGAWDNLVHRTLAFGVKYLHNELPQSAPDGEIEAKVAAAYRDVGAKIENGQLREALAEIFGLVRFGNRYYDARQPWKTRTEDPAACRETISSCTWLIGNLAVLLHPFLPFSSDRVLGWLGLTPQWKPQSPTAKSLPDDFSLLFSRI